MGVVLSILDAPSRVKSGGRRLRLMFATGSSCRKAGIISSLQSDPHGTWLAADWRARLSALGPGGHRKRNSLTHAIGDRAFRWRFAALRASFSRLGTGRDGEASARPLGVLSSGLALAALVLALHKNPSELVGLVMGLADGGLLWLLVVVKLHLIGSRDDELLTFLTRACI